MMQFPYFQLQYAIHAQGIAIDWSLSPTPIFRFVQSGADTKGFFSSCYGILLPSYLEDHPCTAKEKWEQDVGQLDELWDNVLDSVLYSSLNTAQKLSQLYIVLRVQYTPTNCTAWISYKPLLVVNVLLIHLL